ncbi:MAG: serine hydrolase [Robiginitomaculum sp.]
MGKFLKWTGALLLVLAIALFFNRGKITRLLAVNSLFDEGAIVQNFSSMDRLMFTHDLPISGSPHIWTHDTYPLPETVTIAGEPRNLQGWLKEASATGLVIVAGPNIAFEDYYLGTGVDDKRISWSMAKSFLSALIGTAVERGEIKSLDDQVTDYVPMLKGSAYEGATIRNVLNMASGVAFDEDYLDPKSDINKMGRVLALGGSMDEFAANVKTRAREPGTAMQYVSIDTHVIGMVLRKATGQSVHDVFLERLWSKMGPSADAYYMTDGYDHAFVLGGLNMKTRDYALFGKLMRDGGLRGEQQIIPSDWVAAATRRSAPTGAGGSHNDPGIGYGYQWWIPPATDNPEFADDFFAVGVYGQYIYVNPTLDIVIAKNAAHREFMSASQSGNGYMLENIDVFRSLASHYGIAPGD